MESEISLLSHFVQSDFIDFGAKYSHYLIYGNIFKKNRPENP